MRWWRISRLSAVTGSVAESTWCGGEHLRPGRRDAHDRQPALIGAVIAEPEYAVDAGKAGACCQRFFGKSLRAMRLHQRGHQRDGIIRERRRRHRILIEALAVARGEIPIAGGVG